MLICIEVAFAFVVEAAAAFAVEAAAVAGAVVVMAAMMLMGGMGRSWQW